MIVPIVGGSASELLGLIFLDDPHLIQVPVPAVEGNNEVMATTQSYYLVTFDELEEMEIAEDMLGYIKG